MKKKQNKLAYKIQSKTLVKVAHLRFTRQNFINLPKYYRNQLLSVQSSLRYLKVKLNSPRPIKESVGGIIIKV